MAGHGLDRLDLDGLGLAAVLGQLAGSTGSRRRLAARVGGHRRSDGSVRLCAPRCQARGLTLV